MTTNITLDLLLGQGGNWHPVTILGEYTAPDRLTTGDWIYWPRNPTEAEDMHLQERTFYVAQSAFRHRQQFKNVPFAKIEWRGYPSMQQYNVGALSTWEQMAYGINMIIHNAWIMWPDQKGGKIRFPRNMEDTPEYIKRALGNGNH
jgi:hypothetical protein